MLKIRPDGALDEGQEGVQEAERRRVEKSGDDVTAEFDASERRKIFGVATSAFEDVDSRQRRMEQRRPEKKKPRRWLQSDIHFLAQKTTS